MPDRSLRASARTDDRTAFVGRLRAWLDTNDSLMAGLVRLRELPRSDDAVVAVLEVPELLRTRLSWELWEAMVAGDGEVDPDVLLFGQIPIAMLAQARLAFYGADMDCWPRHLRSV